MGYTPMLAEEQIARERMANQMPAPEESGDPHLRSMAEVDGYEIAASDGEIGTVADFLINPLDWRVRYLVIDTGNWLPGKKVIVATGWISDVDWSNQRVSLEINRHKVETSPDMDTVPSLQRSDEARLFEHYGAVPYWTA
jgi:hypothetical protein